MAYDEYGNYLRRVVELVKSHISYKRWYNGVCTDTIRNSFEQELSIEEAAEIAEDDTFMWDGFCCSDPDISNDPGCDERITGPQNGE